MATRKARVVGGRKSIRGRDKPAESGAIEPREAPSTPVAARPSLVVGIGASAGGLAALEMFFEALPHDSGMSFVVVTHQPPNRPSLLRELLERRTRMPVSQVADETLLEPNHVYVSAPGKNLAVLNRKLQLMEAPPRPSIHLPIDYFFRSLAHDIGEDAACVVLSGTGTDGTLGLREIKAHSGIAMVQDEQSAHYGGMPHSAASTLLADFVLRPDQMPAQLIAYVRGHGALLSAADSGLSVELESSLSKIFVLLRNRLGHDFTGYKRNTLQRRIERRMRVHQLIHPADYIRLLQIKQHELDQLFQDLLITVTQFFRDEPAYQALEAELTKKFEREHEPISLRVWVAGCATGEEAYSIAIVALELAARLGKRLQLQIFATDLDPRAVAFARNGLYAEGIAADVSRERLTRFFSNEARGRRIQQHVRDCVVFATQNLLRDPPFTRLDLLSCRNVLIYLTADLQDQLLPLFHYSLKPDGMLWLGPSETASEHSTLFSPLERKWKLYQRRPAQSVPSPLIEGQLTSNFKRRNLISVRGVMRPDRRTAHGPTSMGQMLDTLLARRYAPTSLVVTGRGEIAYVHGRTGPFLEVSSGEPAHNLLAMARDGLRLPLQAALRRAAADEQEVVDRDIPVQNDGKTQLVHIVVRRLTEPEPMRGLFRVSFLLSKTTVQTKGRRGKKKPPTKSLASESELKRVRDSLHGTLSELQTSNEELTSANEEMQSVNEELQSTNEELETSREEMQSMNEELQTVNGELNGKVEELAQLNDDMQNLLNSTDVATLFLDKNLKIKRFTEQTRRIVRLIASDVGRSIEDLVPQIHYETFGDDAREVLETLQPREAEVQSLAGKWLLVRILPYRTAQNMIDGVVVTFVDIDRLKRAESLVDANKIADSIVQSVREPLVVLDTELRIVASNPAFSRLVGMERAQLDRRSVFVAFPELQAPRKLREMLDGVLIDGRAVEEFDCTFESARLGSHSVILNVRRLEEVGGAALRLLIGLAFTPPEPAAAESH